MVRRNKNKSVMKLVEGEGRRKSGPIMGIPGFELIVALVGLAFAVGAGRRRVRQKGVSVRVKE
ncbi:MAG: PGF-CTERM sorting domain-containing protein [Promethearchaeota archaeon]